MQLLLINPSTAHSFWGLEYSIAISGLKASNAPLGLITIAALTPAHWDVQVVGIGAMSNQATRAFELARAFRDRGRTVVIGGAVAFSSAEQCAEHADAVVVGEAERTWPQFCRDLEAGHPARRYEDRADVDLADSPTPRFDLLKQGVYASIPIQTSRGCPHSCEFCDIIVMFGRRVRTKPVAHVLAEVEAVRVHSGHNSIFFTDDNFNGNVKYVRELLRGLIELRDRTDYRPLLFTQASVNLAEQDELLDLMVRAGFTRLFLGVETPRQLSLQEAGKRQNLRGSLIDNIHKIQAAGIVTWAGMIVGFDHDDPEVFAEQAEFLDEAGIAVAMVGLFNAVPGTPLYQRLQREGRLLQEHNSLDNCAWTNIVPKRMSRAQLFRGYSELISELYTQENFTRRLMRNIHRMRPAPHGVASTRLPSWSDLRDLLRAVSAFTFSRRADYRRHFVPNLLRVVLTHFSRAVETCVHLGVWKHFDQYVPIVVSDLERAERRAQVERLLPPPPNVPAEPPAARIAAAS